MNILEITKF
jgi:hypothetical protein